MTNNCSTMSLKYELNNFIVLNKMCQNQTYKYNFLSQYFYIKLFMQSHWVKITSSAHCWLILKMQPGLGTIHVMESTQMSKPIFNFPSMGKESLQELASERSLVGLLSQHVIGGMSDICPLNKPIEQTNPSME